MRVPSLILLSSAALALLVRAEEAPLPPPAAVIRTESKDEIPVGKGIVYTKTSFFTNRRKATPKEEKVEVKAQSEETVSDKDKQDEREDEPKKNTIQSTTKKIAQRFLGLDVNLGGDGTKYNSEVVSSADLAWFFKPLYGDDGYVPRPVPKRCDPLAFKDQMIWDQQGDADTERTRRYNADNTVDDTRQRNVDTVVPDVAPAIAGPYASITPEEKKEDRDIDEMSVDDTVIDKETAATADVTTAGGDDKQKMNGIRICILGLCIGGNDDDDDDDDDDDRPPHSIKHNQKKFLRQFRGKKLRLDSRTGCPLPYNP
ncbi:hypothetical protein BGZ83_000314 [Gryganskiella cystojenkinii]|nr:hypothetical protein BGZ83_000314 [Gryganskiella cystojenkinii]